MRKFRKFYVTERFPQKSNANSLFITILIFHKIVAVLIVLIIHAMYIYCTSKEQTEITPPWSSTRTSEQELRKYPSLCTIVHWTGTPLQCLCLRDVSPLEPLSTALMKPEVRHTITWFFTSWFKKNQPTLSEHLESNCFIYLSC